MWELLRKRLKSTADHFRANYSTPIWSLQFGVKLVILLQTIRQEEQTHRSAHEQVFRVLRMPTDLGTISRQRLSHSRRNTNKSTLKEKH